MTLDGILTYKTTIHIFTVLKPQSEKQRNINYKSSHPCFKKTKIHTLYEAPIQTKSDKIF
jgi:hypothetical protein